MGKSLGNAIYLSDTVEDVNRKVMSAVTDPGRIKKDDLGTNVSAFTFFPCLIKLIDSASPLSVQVHPSDEYALKNENSYGKTEMWYILDHEKDAGIYVGFKNNETQSDVEKALNNGTILDKLNFFKVKKGECYFIKSGTIHAIGKGVTLIEIQQNSNLTYRLYDYNRKDKNGNTLDSVYRNQLE